VASGRSIRQEGRRQPVGCKQPTNLVISIQVASPWRPNRYHKPSTPALDPAVADVHAASKSPLLYSRSLPHRLGRGNRILSRHEREREGVRDTPSWVAGPRLGAGGGVVAMATIGVEAARAAAQTRSRRPSGRQRH
jgi:hypothetical protein